MRASCEHCGAFQPPDWRAGDACTSCGKIARREARCFWCCTWVPTGGYCRSCGAAILDHRLFGPARMLKDAGVDRFTLPKMLKEMDPEQVENFDRIYQRQAAVVARHVDDAVFLQNYLFSKQWGEAVEEELIRRLPWQPADLDRFDRNPSAHLDGLHRAMALEAESPVELNRSLATIVRIRLDDWRVFDAVRNECHSANAALREEAALAATSWRVLYSIEDAFRRGTFQPVVFEELRRSAHKDHAAVRLALLGEKVDVPPGAIGSDNRELRIGAALAAYHPDTLAAVLDGDMVEQRAAGTALAFHGDLAPLDKLLRHGHETAILAVLDTAAYRNKKGSPLLRDALFGLIERTTNLRLRDRAARLLCRACTPDDGLRIVKLAQGDRGVVQCVLQTADLPPYALEEIIRHLIETDAFSMSQFGLSTVAEKGLIPDDFVPRVFHSTNEETQQELCRFAEIQITQRGDEQLHRFLNNVAYGPYPGKTRAAAWWSLRRWYLRDDPRGENPAALHKDAAERFFGSTAEFSRRIAAMIVDEETCSEVGMWEDLARILREADLAALLEDKAATETLVRAVEKMMANDQIHFTLRIAGPVFLAGLGQSPVWQARVQQVLSRFQNTDLDYQCKSALERLNPDN
ncbi:MAG: hypothetical protein U0R19_31940 [Bryobacteraceae bacterium]